MREGRSRFRRDQLPLLDRVNTFYVPNGEYPMRGWLLLPRKDYDQLNRYSTTLQLEIGDPRKQHNVGTLKNLAIVQAQCVTRGLSADENALYLIEITDARGVISNRWFRAPTTNRNFNIRSPAYPETFQTDSLDGGTTWTWTKMIQNLWEQMPSLGAYPGLPYAPSGTPEGFWFVGVSVWKALCGVLEHLGMDIACDLTADAPYTIVDPGAADASFDTLTTRYATHLQDDLEWLDVGSGRVPGTVKVLFRRRNAIYGTEETVTYRNDGMAQQWDMNTAYSVSVSAPATFSGATGTHYLWSDFTVRYDLDSVPLAADTTLAAQIATERVEQYFREIYDRTLGYMTRTYAGALPFKTGSRVDGVCWRHAHEGNRVAWETQLVRGPEPPWPGLWD